MIAVPCPRCGRPSAVSLATPDAMRCIGCGFAGPPPPDRVHALRAAAWIVSSADIHARQLSAALRATLQSARQQVGAYRIVLVLVSLPMTLFCLAMIGGMAVDDDTEGNVTMSIFMGLAWASTVGAGLVGYTLLRKRLLRLEASCAATPPQAPGEAATCHVCGAPLTGDLDGVARCGFCAADNLVRPDVLSRLGHRRALVMGEYEGATRAQLQALGEASTRTGAAMLPLAIGLPFACTVLLIAALAVSDASQLEVDGSVRYATLPTSLGPCIGKVVGKSVRFGTWRPPALPKSQPLGDAETFGPKSLVGRKVRHHNGTVGRIEAVYSSILQGNAAVVRRPSGGPLHTSIAGLCVVDSSDGG